MRMKDAQMKKLIFSMVLIAVLLLAVPTFAAAEGITLSCTATNPDENGNCDVAVELSGCEGIAMMQLCLLYNAEELSCVGAETGILFRDTLAPTINIQRPGEIVLSWDSLTPLQSGGTMLLLHMCLLGDEAEMVFSGGNDLVLAREDFIPLEVDRVGCAIQRGATEVPGTPVPTETDAPIETPLPTETDAPTETPVPPEAPVLSVSAKEIPEETGLGIEPDTETPASVMTSGESNGLTMQREQITVDAGKTVVLTIQEAEPSLVWFSSDERVATVDENGTVTAHEDGTALITVSTDDGTAYGSCVVTVSDHLESVTEKTDQPHVEEKEETQQSSEQTQAAPSESPHQQLSENLQPPPDQEDERQGYAFFSLVIVIVISSFLLLWLLLRKKRRRQVK